VVIYFSEISSSVNTGKFVRSVTHMKSSAVSEIISKSSFEFRFGQESKTHGEGSDSNTFKQFRHLNRFSQSFQYLPTPGLHYN